MEGISSGNSKDQVTRGSVLDRETLPLMPRGKSSQRKGLRESKKERIPAEKKKAGLTKGVH